MFRRDGWSTAALILTGILPAAAFAQVQFNLPAEPLSRALKELASQADLNVYYDRHAVAGLQSRALRADLTPRAAFARLLAGTDLVAVYVDEDTVRVVAKNGRKQAHDGDEVEPHASPGETDRNTDPSATRPSSRDAAPEGGTGAVLAEVFVTAQKRKETIDTTPIAVSALTGAQLQARGVTTVTGLTSNVPDLQVHTVAVDGYFGVAIRGISNLVYTPDANPAVATYIDGVYVDLPYGLTDELFDLSRIEVLRGPQGTLYGRNSTGGEVNIITASPEHVFDANWDASYGNYNDFMTRAMVNVPVSHSFAIRAAGMLHQNSGYFDSEGTTPRNYGSADDWAARITGLWTPIDHFRWQLSVDSFLSQGTPGQSVETGPNGKPLDGLSPYHQPVNPDPTPNNYLRSNSIRSRIDWHISHGLAATYIAGYQDLLQHYQWATTGQVGAPLDPAYQDYTEIASKSESQELDLAYRRKRFRDVMGAMYFHDGIELGYHAIYPILALTASANDEDTFKNSWGLFDQATYSILHDLRITGGVRYSHDSQKESGYASLFCAISDYPGLMVSGVQSLTASSPGCGAYSTPGGSGSWSKVTWKAGLDYDLSSRTFTYASVTTGYKQGGVQPGLPSAFPKTYLPEQVTNYELGLKSRLLNQSLSARTAVFYEDYRDIQIAQLVSLPGVIANATTNAGKARIYGLEFEGAWNVTALDHLSSFITYLHARYTHYTNAVDPRFGGSVIIPSLAGDQLPDAPDVSLRVQYSHVFELPKGGTLTPTVAVYWQSRSYTNALNIDYYSVDAYSKTDLRLTYYDPARTWEVSGYVSNLENHAVRTGDYSGSGVVFSDFAPPRTYGVRIAYRY